MLALLHRKFFLFDLVLASAPIERLPLDLHSQGRYVVRQEVRTEWRCVIEEKIDVRDVVCLSETPVVLGLLDRHLCLSKFRPIRQGECLGGGQVLFNLCSCRYGLYVEIGSNVASKQEIQL